MTDIPSHFPPQPPAVERPATTPSAAVVRIQALFDRITHEIAKIYVGQDELVLSTLVALFSSGHVLIESVPGFAKTGSQA